MKHLEAYLYSEGPASSTVYDGLMNCANTIGVDEGAGRWYARLQAPLRFTDALSAWQVEMNASSGTGVYSVTYSAATQRVTIATTNAVPFTLTPQGNVGRALGFGSTSYASATSHVGESVPGAYIRLIARECHPAMAGEQVDLRTYRHQRALSIGFSNAIIWTLQLYFSGDDVPAAFARDVVTKSGYALSGRVRLSGNGSPYSETNPSGDMDGYVVGTSNLRGEGDDEGFLHLTMLLGVSA